MDRKRDAPIPWSVSLPCLVALGALLFGWHSLATPPRPEEAVAVEAQARLESPAVPDPEPAPAAAPAPAPLPESKHEATSASKTDSEKQPETQPVRAAEVDPAPIHPSAPAAASNWLSLATIGVGDLPAGADEPGSRALLQWRDRLGSRASAFVARRVERARVVVVAASETRAQRGDRLERDLAAFGERLQSRILVPARIDAARRPWVDLFVGEPLDAGDFDGVVASASGPLPLAAIGELQLRGALTTGPELRALPGAIAGAAGVAASESLSEALAAPEPLPLLVDVVRWQDWERLNEFARGATSFAAFCLARGPRDAAATGFFDLLKLDASFLPGGDEARAAEIAARLGATRLEELDAAWRAARRG